MHRRVTITSKNVNQMAWMKGYRGVAGLARELGVHRVSVFRAASGKSGFKRLRSRLEAVLTQPGGMQ